MDYDSDSDVGSWSMDQPDTYSSDLVRIPELKTVLLVFGIIFLIGIVASIFFSLCQCWILRKMNAEMRAESSNSRTQYYRHPYYYGTPSPRYSNPRPISSTPSQRSSTDSRHGVFTIKRLRSGSSNHRGPILCTSRVPNPVTSNITHPCDALNPHVNHLPNFVPVVSVVSPCMNPEALLETKSSNKSLYNPAGQTCTNPHAALFKTNRPIRNKSKFRTQPNNF